MLLINRKYKVLNILNEDKYGSTMVVEDMLHGQMVKSLRMLNQQKETQGFIEYMKANFYDYRNLKHVNLADIYFFNKATNVDNKPVVAGKYYYTFEHLSGQNLFEYVRDRDFDSKLDLAVQLCAAVKYLHLRGFLLCHVKVSELQVVQERQKAILKITAIPYLEGTDRSVIFDTDNNYFKSPEAFQFGSYTRSSDVYLIGALLFFLFTGKRVEGSNFREKISSFEPVGDYKLSQIKAIIGRCISLKPSERYDAVEKIISDINVRLGKAYNIINKKDLQKLSRYTTKLVSRDPYFKRIINSVKGYFFENRQIRLTAVMGGFGTGKSVFIKATAYRLEQEGVHVVSSRIREEDSCSFFFIVGLIKEIIRDVDKELVDKYIAEISYLIPELSGSLDIAVCNSLLRQEDKVRLIYRLGNFLLEVSAKYPFVIAVSGFEWIDEDSVAVLNYILRSESKGKIYMVMGIDLQSFEEDVRIKGFLQTFMDKGYGDYLELGNFNIYETAEYIRLLLSMDKAPLDFAAKIFKETEGNPNYIYEVIYYLYINGYIYVDDQGEWVLNEVDISGINTAFNSNNTIISKISRLSELQHETVKIISIFNTAVSCDILKGMMEIDEAALSGHLQKLDDINILSRKVDDWGISYDFSSINLKKTVYDRIPQQDKLKYHKKASFVLEEKFIKENRENKDELIFHMTKADRHREAIEYLMDSAEKMIASNLLSQAIQFLEQSFSLFAREEASSEKIQVCAKLGELYEQIGDYGKAIFFYDIVENISEDMNENTLLVNACIDKSTLLLKLNDVKSAVDYALKAKRLLRRMDYPEGLYELIIRLSPLMNYRRKYAVYIKILENAVNLVDMEKYPCYHARMLTTLGRFICNKNRYEEGLGYLLKGIPALERLNASKYLPEPLLSVGYIYSEFYNDLDKAWECYETSLNISQKLNNLNIIERNYNNLAEILRLQGHYHEALMYYNKALDVVHISQNLRIKSLIYTNLIMLSIEMEDYIKAAAYTAAAENLLNSLNGSGNLALFFHQHLAEYHYAIGDFERAEAYAQKSVDMCISWGIPENLESLTVKRLSEIEREGSLDFAKDSELCRRIFGDNLYKLGRGLCVKLAEIYAGKGEKVEEARLFLEQGRRYADKIDTEILRLRYDYVETLLAEGEDHHNKLFRLAGRAENVENNEIHWKIYKAVAMALVDQGDYREALRYLISALNDLRKLVYSVPDEYKVRFIESHGRNTVKESLERVSGLLTGHMEAETESVSLYSMDKYFDYTAYRELYRRKDEERGAVINISAHNKFLGKIQELLGKFTEDDGENLKQLIQLYAETTQAKNAFIATLSEDGSLNILASYNRYNENPFYEYMIEQVKQKKDSILVTDTFEYSRKKGEILIPKEITAVFCIPITVPKESEGVGYVEEKRRYREQGSNPAIGYIYADTDSIINNFTEESSGFCILASRMAYVLVDNYNLKMVSMVDKLTKLYTRKYFEAALQNELAYAEKEDGAFSIVMIDIDKFKTVNDRYGHQKGDEILQNVSSIIMNTVRKGDVCGRYGGEEIILLLPSTKREDALQVAEKLRKKIENAKLLGLNNPLTVSLGIATYPEHGTWAKDLIDKADQAMYHVKESGRNGSRVYEANMSKHTRRIDKLAGIISGDLVEDQRKVETLLEILELTRQEGKSVKEKLFCFLGRVIEVSEAQTGILFKVEETEEGKARIGEQIARKKLVENAVKEVYCNMDIIERCMESRSGEYLLDWSGYPGIDAVTGMPDWQSVIAVPLTLQGRLQGIIYLSVSIKNREFDANTYNYVKTLCDIVSAVY